MPIAPTNPTGSLRHTTLLGIAWAALQVLTSKLSTLATQAALGWLLTSSDFAHYAMALSASAFAIALSGSSVNRVLIHKGTHFDEFAGRFLRLNVIVSCSISAVLAISSPWIARCLAEPAVAPLIATLCIAIAIAPLAQAPRARLSAQLRFQTVARINIASNLFRQLLTIGLALNSFGPFSLALPMLITPVFDIAVFVFIDAFPPLRGHAHRLTIARLVPMARDLKWALISSLGTALALHGDYLAIALLGSASLLGAYYFGFQLITAFSSLFTSQLDSILLPAFASVRHTTARMASAYNSMARATSTVIIPACFAIFFAAPPGYNLMWGDKWKDAAFVSQMMALALTTRLVSPVARTVCQARGLWRLDAQLIWIDAAATASAAAAGALVGTVPAIAIIVCCQRFAMGAIQLLVGARVAGLGIRPVLDATLRPFIASLASACAVLSTRIMFTSNEVTASSVPIELLLYLIISVPLQWIILRARWAEVFSLIKAVPK